MWAERNKIARSSPFETESGGSHYRGPWMSKDGFYVVAVMRGVLPERVDELSQKRGREREREGKCGRRRGRVEVGWG